MKPEIYNKYVKPVLYKGEKKIVEDALNTPKRDISKNSKVMNYINKHGVYITLTSSPKRLRKTAAALAIVLQNPHIRKVYLTLPKLYRNKTKYSQAAINFVKGVDKRITVRRPAQDIGPITKMLPTLQMIRDKNAIVISMDDDICYPASLINELIYYSVRYPNTIFTGSGFNWGDDGYDDSDIDRRLWPIRRKPRYPHVDIVEGWGMIAYKKRLLDLARMKRLSKLDTNCKLSDDLTISYVLAEKRVPMKVIVNRYYDDQGDLHPFEYGLQEDALHRGSGLGTDVENANMVKYKACLELINKKLKGKTAPSKTASSANKNKTVVQLKAQCKKKGIKGYSKMRKAELIRKC